MRKTTFVVFLLFAISSCVSVNLSGHKISEESKKFKSLLVVFSDSDQTFYQWDEENYDLVINTRFNNLDDEKYRNIFGKALQSKLSNTRLLFADKLFQIHKPISYAGFNQQLAHLEVDGILLVHTKGQWIQESVIDGDTVTKPNAEWHIFLIDKADMQNMWIGKSGAYGSAFNNFSDLYEKMSKEIGSSLSAKGFINKPLK